MKSTHICQKNCTIRIWARLQAALFWRRWQPQRPSLPSATAQAVQSVPPLRSGAADNYPASQNISAGRVFPRSAISVPCFLCRSHVPADKILSGYSGRKIRKKKFGFPVTLKPFACIYRRTNKTPKQKQKTKRGG